MHELGRAYRKSPAQLTDLKHIARSQKLSLKYIEHIITQLRRGKLVQSVRGVTGGYRLSRAPEKITMLEVLEVTEKISDFCPCFKQTSSCPFEKACGLCDFWKGLRAALVKHLQGITLADILSLSRTGSRR